MMRTANITAAAIALVAAAAFDVATAHAGSVTLWACHGPGGEGLGAAPFVSATEGDGGAEAIGLGCGGPSGTGGLSATLSESGSASGSSASWRLPVPAGATLESVRVARTTSGFGAPPIAGDPQWYRAWTSSATLEFASLESGSASLSGERSFDPASGEYVSLGVGCGPVGDCAGPPVGVEISSIALGVEDDSPPTGEVTGVESPVAGGTTLHLLLKASDPGLGLASAQASLDGQTQTVVPLGGPSCPEHPSANLTYGADCPHSVAGVPLSIDVGQPGAHELRVSVTDAAGNTATVLDRTITVESQQPSPGSNTITLGVGGEPPHTGSGEGEGNEKGKEKGKGKGKGGVLGSASSGAGVCRSPLLSMRLASKPLRWVKRQRRRIPLLRARHDYVFRGRLTCLSNGRRISAPTGTVLHVYYKIGRQRAKLSGRGTMTVHNGTLEGNLRAILGYSYTSSRTLVFRYHPGAGVLVQVTIPVKVVGRRKAESSRGRKAGRRR